MEGEHEFVGIQLTTSAMMWCTCTHACMHTDIYKTDVHTQFYNKYFNSKVHAEIQGQ